MQDKKEKQIDLIQITMTEITWKFWEHEIFLP